MDHPNVIVSFRELSPEQLTSLVGGAVLYHCSREMMECLIELTLL